MREELERAERELARPKDWRYVGEVDASSRPANSLLCEKDIEYERYRGTGSQSSCDERRLLGVLRQRIRERRFDNFEYSYSVQKEEVHTDQVDVEEDAEVDRRQMEELFVEIKNEVASLTNVAGVWNSAADIKMYEEKAIAVEDTKKTRRQDKASMKVLKRAKNVKMLR